MLKIHAFFVVSFVLINITGCVNANIDVNDKSQLELDEIEQKNILLSNLRNIDYFLNTEDIVKVSKCSSLIFEKINYAKLSLDKFLIGIENEGNVSKVYLLPRLIKNDQYDVKDVSENLPPWKQKYVRSSVESFVCLFENNNSKIIIETLIE